VDIEVI